MKPEKTEQGEVVSGQQTRKSARAVQKEAISVIKYPVSSEKAIRLMESENKLVFVVDIKAEKPEIKKAVEELFKAKVVSVNTLIYSGEKRAYVRFAPESPAIDIATSLGLM